MTSLMTVDVIENNGRFHKWLSHLCHGHLRWDVLARIITLIRQPPTIHTFDIQIEWNMNFVALKATDRKVIIFTINYKIQRYQCTALCRHKSIHVTNTRHESARTRLYNDKGLQTRLRDSKICQVVSGGYMKRDHLTRLVRALTKQNRKRDIWNKHVCACDENNIQRQWHRGRCRHTSIHITYTRNTSQ